jgi:uncharacterized protein
MRPPDTLATSMVPSLIAEALTLYRARLEDALPARVLRVTLFGSHARGEAHEDSDVDVLVLLEHATHAERARAIDVGGLVGMDLLLPIAPVVMTAAEWAEMVARERLFVREIARDGVEA